METFLYVLLFTRSGSTQKLTDGEQKCRIQFTFLICFRYTVLRETEPMTTQIDVHRYVSHRLSLRLMSCSLNLVLLIVRIRIRKYDENVVYLIQRSDCRSEIICYN